jgi:hypothetical protein
MDNSFIVQHCPYVQKASQYLALIAYKKIELVEWLNDYSVESCESII